jgi:cytochrome b561
MSSQKNERYGNAAIAYALFGLAGLHALIAQWHQSILRDGLIARMWPRAG